MAVGDIRQRILASPTERGTLEEAFELVGNDISVQVHRLTKNFRSVQEILDFANALHSELGYQQQAVRGSRGIRPAIIHVSLLNSLPASATVKDRDEAVLHQMVDAAQHHMKLLPLEDAGSVAFLVARNEQSYPVHQCLKRSGRPFAVLENQRRYQTYHIKRVLTYFRLIQDSSQKGVTDGYDHSTGAPTRTPGHLGHRDRR